MEVYELLKTLPGMTAESGLPNCELEKNAENSASRAALLQIESWECC